MITIGWICRAYCGRCRCCCCSRNIRTANVKYWIWLSVTHGKVVHAPNGFGCTHKYSIVGKSTSQTQALPSQLAGRLSWAEPLQRHERLNFQLDIIIFYEHIRARVRAQLLRFKSPPALLVNMSHTMHETEIHKLSENDFRRTHHRICEFKSSRNLYSIYIRHACSLSHYTP